MLETLKTKRWLTWLAVATMWALLCVLACQWQWGRWQEKSAIEHRIDTNYDATPVPVGSVLRPDAAPGRDDEWKQVQMRGHYEPRTLMVRNRPGNSGDFGFQVVNVLTTDAGRVIVDRGWVPNGSSAKTPSTTPKPPSGEVTVTGWVRPSEKSLGRQPVPGQLASISVTDVQHATGEQVLNGYVRMRTEKTANNTTPPHPETLDKPTQAQAAGINLSYAIQWALGAIAGYAFVLLRARREHLDQQIMAGERPAKAPKPKKTRIWDEEDE